MEMEILYIQIKMVMKQIRKASNSYKMNLEIKFI